MIILQQRWHEQNKKLVLDILSEPNADVVNQLLLNYSHELRALVTSIDRMIIMVEHSQAQATRLLRSFQWLSENEGAKFWFNVLTERLNLGVKKFSLPVLRA